MTDPEISALVASHGKQFAVEFTPYNVTVFCMSRDFLKGSFHHQTLRLSISEAKDPEGVLNEICKKLKEDAE